MQLTSQEPVDGPRVQLVQTYTESAPCPECADEGPHDDNGATSLADLSFCCCACHHNFSACEK